MERLFYVAPQQYSPATLKKACAWLEESCQWHDSSCPDGPFIGMEQAFREIQGPLYTGYLIPLKGYTGEISEILKDPVCWWVWFLNDHVATFIARFKTGDRDFILYPRRPESYGRDKGTRYCLIDTSDHQVYILGHARSVVDLTHILAHPNKFPLYLRYFKNKGGYTSWRQVLDQKAFQRCLRKIQGTP
jgi:hypothetical protein